MINYALSGLIEPKVGMLIPHSSKQVIAIYTTWALRALMGKFKIMPYRSTFTARGPQGPSGVNCNYLFA